jgi:phosphoglycerate dehydrogenase-like enzyme
MAKHFILIPDRLKNPDYEKQIMGKNYNIKTFCTRNPDDIPDDIWIKTDAVLLWHEMNFTSEVIDKLANCKVIVRAGVGFDNVDLKAAGKKGIIVCNVPDYGTNDVADHTIAMILSLSRGLYAFSEKIRESNNNWHWNAAGELHRISGSTLGIIGLGRIGTAVALRAKALDLNVVFYDPYKADGYDKSLGIKRCYSLKELLKKSDIVTIHTPLTKETKNMADTNFFTHVKNKSLFINTARGAITNLDALYNALKSGKVRAAGLDVLGEEPPDPNHSLIKAWCNKEEWLAYRLIITPHSAFYCEESYYELREKAALEAKRVLCGNPPRNCVNTDWLKKKIQ